MGTTSGMKRCAFSIAIIALAGCGGSQSQSVTPNAIPVGSTMALNVKHIRSWMLPEAKNKDLLYVGSSNSEVDVYSYPEAKPVGTFYSVGSAGMCPDRTGNVWIADFSGNTVVEYAHGGTTPIGILKVPKAFKFRPLSCAVDSTSGNLAVVGYSSSGRAKVFVYAGATGNPNIYRVDLSTSSFCGYDNDGNLFVTGYRYNGITKSGVVELQKGAKKFRQLSFGTSGPFFGNQPGPVQWDGRHLAIGLGVMVLRFDIHHFKAVRKGETTFGDLHQLANAWIQGDKIIALNTGGEGSFPPIQIYNYPAGGNSIRIIHDGAFGITVSLAPR